jgi:hypothetical protein
MGIKDIGCDGVDWINVAQSRDQLGALGNMVMTFGFYKRREIYLTNNRLFTSRLHSMDLDRLLLDYSIYILRQCY